MTPAAAPSRILIVDDEPDIRDALKGLFEHSLQGVAVFTAESGPRGLDALRKQPVDLIISDFKMPGMNGIEFLVKCRALAPDVPRILITAFPHLELAIQAINDGGISKFITKPFDPTYLLDAVRWTLLQSRADAGPKK